MFTLNHFIWLGICLVIILGVVLVNYKFKFSLKSNLTVYVVICIVCEILKMTTHINYVYEDDVLVRAYLSPRGLPLHLCSIQIFFIFALRFFVKKETTQQKLLLFMFPTMLIGATLALLIPTNGVDFTNPRLYEYFPYHAYMVGFSIYLVVNKHIKINFKAIIRNYGFVCMLFIFELWINSILSAYDTNFLYLQEPPMDGLPLLNLNNGWYVYLCVLVIAGVVLLGTVQLPFAIINYKKDKKMKLEANY